MSPRTGSWKWWVCGALLLATMLNYMDRQTLSLTATQLKTEIHLDDARYGSLEEWFSYAFAAGGIFFGFIADRIGPRRLYPIVLIGWSLAGIATPLADWPPVVKLLGDSGNPGQGEFRWLFVCRTLPNCPEALTSTTSITVNSRSSLNFLMNGCPNRAVTFQSMERTSSPGRYSRTSSNSMPRPLKTE